MSINAADVVVLVIVLAIAVGVIVINGLTGHKKSPTNHHHAH